MPENIIDFEQNLKSLEDIVKKLESGNCSLEESIKLFEDGMKYTAECRKVLDNAQKRIEAFGISDEVTTVD